MIQAYLFDLYGTLVDIRTNEAKPSLWKRLALLLTQRPGCAPAAPTWELAIVPLVPLPIMSAPM